MKAKFKKKPGYTAPRMEATSFRTENGYATSGPAPTKTFSLNVGKGGL